MCTQSLREALRSKLRPASEYLPAEDVVETLAEADSRRSLAGPCPDCGGESVVCCFALRSWGLDFCDQMCHVCVNPACGYACHGENLTPYGQDWGGANVCPWCGRNFFG